MENKFQTFGKKNSNIEAGKRRKRGRESRGFKVFREAFKEIEEKDPLWEKRLRKNILINKVEKVRSWSGFFVCLDEAEKDRFIRKAKPDEIKDIEERIKYLKEKIKEASDKADEEEVIRLKKSLFSLMRRILRVRRDGEDILYLEHEFVKPSEVKEKRPKDKKGEQLGLAVITKLAKLQKELRERNRKK